MKRGFKLGILCLFCLLLTGCEPIHFYYNYEDLSETVVAIELINYDNPEAEMVADNFSRAKHLDFDFDYMGTIEVMAADDFDAFFQDISDQTILNHVRHKDSPVGLCIRVVYESGDFDIISSRYIGRFNDEGGFVEFMGIFDAGLYFDLINQYFTIQID